MRSDKRVQVWVKALYRHSKLLIRLPAGTLMADFAALIDSFGEVYGKPLTITLVPPPRTVPSCCRGTAAIVFQAQWGPQRVVVGSSAA